MSFEIQKARVRPSGVEEFYRSAAQAPERTRSRPAERQGRLRKASPNVAGLSPGIRGWTQRANWLSPFLPIDEIHSGALRRHDQVGHTRYRSRSPAFLRSQLTIGSIHLAGSRPDP